MGWSIGYDSQWDRDIGYGVLAVCDHPKCDKELDRGLGYVCGGAPYGGEYGCGLYFCGAHMTYRSPRGADGYIQNCFRCASYRPPYKPKEDVKEWIDHKMKDPSWAEWRKNNPEFVKKYKK